ncbi:hypothetical protein Pmar_PMAR009239 [Perkinsus marinus ATCC 50983]|uniref:CCHC-type domain-containing protein n=1 Tax=Perkinsus marinus (strain ATCC 50983 / TXsc) TaxID=423536 RepID=C5M0D5_PERM5|nr:hypothetical protein Pmar_PMAR009239 [Perkinsus marinus ATCC 50983]EEQ97542.1 hypothetical protein Pmar_PMAR009239 [Perkinsus marinus ATCC 50983]|eukprot:XP_002764825.1 hypothetical protein Pmar_PMAR009239 [Perkinsus marinus ATCC 50983]
MAAVLDHDAKASLPACPRFSGEGISADEPAKSVELFLKKLSTYLQMKGLRKPAPDADEAAQHQYSMKAAGILKIALEGRAAQLVYSLPEALQDDYDGLATALRSAFGLGRLGAWKAFCRRQMKTSELTDSFLADLRALLDISHPTMQTAAKEALLRSQFIAGLPANTAARTLAIAKSEDLQVSLLSLLGLVKDHLRASKFDDVPPETLGAAGLPWQPSRLGKGRKGAGRGGKGKGRGPHKDSSQSFPPRVCWNCHESGHLKAQCPQLVKSITLAGTLNPTGGHSQQ